MKMYQKIKYLGSVFVIFIFVNLNMMAQSLYFSTPEESVEITSKLLVDEDWGKLSNYYFLKNSDKETIASLKNGSYFIRDKRPEIFHPGVPWKYKNTFPPNFKYLSHIELENDSVEVNVSLEIDQGNDMIQQGISSFYLRKSKKGYQFILSTRVEH